MLKLTVRTLVLCILCTGHWAMFACEAGEQLQIKVTPNTIAVLAFEGSVVDYAPKSPTDQLLELKPVPKDNGGGGVRYVFWSSTPGLKVFASASAAGEVITLQLQEVLVTGDVPIVIPNPPVPPNPPIPPIPPTPTLDVSELNGLPKNVKLSEFYKDFARVVETTTLITNNSQFRATYIDAGKAFFGNTDTASIQPGTAEKIDKVLERHLGLNPTEFDKGKTVAVLKAISAFFAL